MRNEKSVKQGTFGNLELFVLQNKLWCSK